MRSTRPSASAPAGSTTSRATLYTAFKRLEQNGLISSYWGEDGPGARRRYYAITDEGRRRWEENCRDWQTTRALLDALISLEDE